MDGEDIERIVDRRPCAEERRAVAQTAGDETDDERATRRDEARGRSDRDKSGDRTAGGTDDADLAIVGVARRGPT